jgi:hypothetical protein
MIMTNTYSRSADGSVVPPAYLLLECGAQRRLAILRAHASVTRKSRWQDVRRWRLSNWRGAYCALSQGKQSNGEAIWYTHTGAIFRSEQYAETMDSAIRHCGWFTNRDGDEVARGIVGRLTHGRFVAGYEWSCNGERIYFDKIHDDECDAARMADEHARVFAERAVADDARFNAMIAAENAVEDAKHQLRKLWPARHVSEPLRQDVRELIAALRDRCTESDEAARAYECN